MPCDSDDLEGRRASSARASSKKDRLSQTDDQQNRPPSGGHRLGTHADDAPERHIHCGRPQSPAPRHGAHHHPNGLPNNASGQAPRHHTLKKARLQANLGAAPVAALGVVPVEPCKWHAVNKCSTEMARQFGGGAPTACKRLGPAHNPRPYPERMHCPHWEAGHVLSRLSRAQARNQSLEVHWLRS